MINKYYVAYSPCAEDVKTHDPDTLFRIVWVSPENYDELGKELGGKEVGLCGYLHMTNVSFEYMPMPSVASRGKQCKNQNNRGYAKGNISDMDEKAKNNYPSITLTKESYVKNDSFPLRWIWIESQSKFMFCCLKDKLMQPISNAQHLFTVSGEAHVCGKINL
jgi:hypothetical protein